MCIPLFAVAASCQIMVCKSRAHSRHFFPALHNPCVPVNSCMHDSCRKVFPDARMVAVGAVPGMYGHQQLPRHRTFLIQVELLAWASLQKILHSKTSHPVQGIYSAAQECSCTSTSSTTRPAKQLRAILGARVTSKQARNTSATAHPPPPLQSSRGLKRTSCVR